MTEDEQQRRLLALQQLQTGATGIRPPVPQESQGLQEDRSQADQDMSKDIAERRRAEMMQQLTQKAPRTPTEAPIEAEMPMVDDEEVMGPDGVMRNPNKFKAIQKSLKSKL